MAVECVRNLRYKLCRESSAFERHEFERARMSPLEFHQGDAAVFSGCVDSQDQHTQSRLMAGFDQLNQHARRTGGVKKNITMPTGAGFDFVRHQGCPNRLQFLHSDVEVGNTNRDVMQPLTPVCDEFGNHGIIGGGFKKFQPGLPDWNHNHANSFGGHNFLLGKRKAQFFVNRLCIRKRPYRDAEMVKRKRHAKWPPEINNSCSNPESQMLTLPE